MKRPLHVQITTQVLPRERGYRISVMADGKHVCDHVATPGRVIKVRNTLCEQYSELADSVEAGEIPPIPTLSRVALVPCAKCGTQHPRRNSFTDEGEGDEAGRTFFYCSNDCRERH